MKVALTCTHDQYHRLSTALGKLRSTSKTVTVDAVALQRLIIDHGRILARLGPGEVEQTDG